MKKIARKLVGLTLSCLLIFPIMPASVFANEAPEPENALVVGYLTDPYGNTYEIPGEKVAVPALQSEE